MGWLARAVMPAKKRRTSGEAATPESDLPDVTELGARRINKDLLLAVASASHVNVIDVEKVLEGLRTMLLKRLRNKGSARIPKLANLCIKNHKARPAGKKKMIAGVQTELPQRPEKMSLRSVVLKSFRASAIS